MNPQDSTPLAMSVRDVSRRTSISEWEIRAAINRKDLQARRIGRRIIILPEDVETWLRKLPVRSETA